MSAEMYRFDEFVIDSMIGEGGMGKVFRARQVTLDRWVALKVLTRAKETGTFTERFYREAKSAARLMHPNIIQIYTVGEYEGVPYYAMEYVDGADLENILVSQAGDPLNTDEVVEILRSMLKAMVLASEHGIVHRDIKPANIMLTRNGSVKIMDFGLAKNLDHSLTQSGLIVGTPSYMSPEQGAGRPVDERSDLYSLGCVLYACLAGTPPYSADNVAALLFKHAYEAPPPITRPGAHPDLVQIALKMLAKPPEERFQTSRAALEALAKVPSNPTAAELSLGKRASNCQQMRVLQLKDKTIISPEGFDGTLIPHLPDTPLPAVTETNSVTPPTDVPPLKAAFLAGAKTVTPPTEKAPGFMATATQKLTPLKSTTPPETPAVQDPSAKPPPKIPSSAMNTMILSPEEAAGIEPAMVPSTPEPAQQSSPTAIVPPPPPPPKGRESSGTLAGADSLRRKLMRIDDAFVKLGDGRWAYKLEMGHCRHAEGLAAALPYFAGGKPEGLGDCVLCSNWSKRTGCAIATTQMVERQTRYTGLKLVVEQTIVWASIGRFDKGVALLNEYIKQQPNDPEGYRELARLYDRPDYKGREKRRALVLYQRFAELAKQIPNFNKIEIQRAEDRATAIAASPSPPESKTTALTPSIACTFNAFYRGPLLCFTYGVLTMERLTIMRGGDVDPETGIQAADMGGAMERATSIFRRFKSENARKEEQALVKKELARLAELPLETLQTDSGRLLSIAIDSIIDVKMTVDQAIGTRTVSLQAPQPFQLLFTEPQSFRAEQVVELVRRHIVSRQKT